MAAYADPPPPAWMASPPYATPGAALATRTAGTPSSIPSASPEPSAAGLAGVARSLRIQNIALELERQKLVELLAATDAGGESADARVRALERQLELERTRRGAVEVLVSSLEAERDDLRAHAASLDGLPDALARSRADTARLAEEQAVLSEELKAAAAEADGAARGRATAAAQAESFRRELGFLRRENDRLAKEVQGVREADADIIREQAERIQAQDAEIKALRTRVESMQDMDTS